MNKRHLKYLEIDPLEIGGPSVSPQPQTVTSRIRLLPRPLVVSVERVARMLGRYRCADTAERRRPS